MWKEKLKIYDELVSKCSRFERKGKTMPYTSANGYMFSLLNKDGEIGIHGDQELGAGQVFGKIDREAPRQIRVVREETVELSLGQTDLALLRILLIAFRRQRSLAGPASNGVGLDADASQLRVEGYPLLRTQGDRLELRRIDVGPHHPVREAHAQENGDDDEDAHLKAREPARGEGLRRNRAF